MRKNGFSPIIGNKPRVLILGSMPSEKSLAEQQYYAHPRNAFWPIMAKLFDFEPTLVYSARARQLIRHHVAVWDVIAACKRNGSLDSAIESDSIEPNDFIRLFSQYPTIEYILFNGAKAAQEYKRRVLPQAQQKYPELEYQLLPSTSPANAGMSYQQKIAKWKVIVNFTK